MKKTLIFAALMAVTTANSSDISSCSYTKEFICNESEFSYSIDEINVIKQSIKNNFDNKGELSAAEKQTLNSKLTYLSKLSDQAHACEKTLFGTSHRSRVACELSLKTKKEISSNLFLSSTTKELRVLDGKCQEVESVNMERITNRNDDLIAYSLKGRWVLSNSPTCKTKNGEVTHRNIQIGGKSEKYKRDGYMFILDLADDEKYYNSTFRARRVSLGDSRLNITSDSDDLLFKWDNGAFIKLSSEDGKIIDSNLLSENSIRDNNCKTKKFFTKKGSPRMIPEIKLGAEFDHLKITSPLNR